MNDGEKGLRTLNNVYLIIEGIFFIAGIALNIYLNP